MSLLHRLCQEVNTMKHPVPVLSLILLVLAIAIALACGASSPHRLQSITLNPIMADAMGGPVQFTATGNYNLPPQQVTPQSATWSACFQGASTTAVSVTSEGLATCASGASGTYTIFAFVTSCKGFVPGGDCGTGPCTVTGTAALRCP
jgi:hypothetical protein